MICQASCNNEQINNIRDLTDRRRAMTLFEVLLVLVLLVVVGSLSMPLLEGGFASIRLRRSGDQLIAAWTEARIQAIQTGETHQFLFQPETGLYRVEPWLPNVEPGTAPLGVAPATTEPTKPVWLPYEAQLPEEIVFAEGDGIVVAEGDQRAVQTLNQTGQSTWAAPIMFYPDGTTSSASLLLRNERKLFQRLTLRSLTGVARASDILTREEAEQLKGR